VNPQPVFPGAKVAVESEALRDLVARDDFALDSLVALVRTLADSSVLLSRLVDVRNEPVVVAGLKLREQVVNRSPHLGKLLDDRRAVHYRVITRSRALQAGPLFHPRFGGIVGRQHPIVALTRLAIWKENFCTNAIVRQPQNETMKTSDSQLRQELLETIYKPYENSFNQNNATAVAALYTEDALLWPPERGPVYGREAIEKYYADLFREYDASDCVIRPDRDSPQIIGTDGKLGSSGNWSATLKPKTGGDSKQLKSKWKSIYALEDLVWKIEMDTWE
jgi:ketosteroid isomerase-like protein